MNAPLNHGAGLAEPFDIEVDRPSLYQIIRSRRGWSEQHLAEINEPDYDQLKDLDVLCAQLKQIREAGEQIVVLPDFDMDGVTSGVLAWAGLNELGFDAQLYVPDHRRGHDISADAVTELREQYPHAAAIITCDGGINSHNGIATARSLGLKTLVTDHHLELPPGSNADVAVNPARMDEDYSHPGICGAFVMYQVLMHYAAVHARHKVADISFLKLFAGIGTVSDVMPLLYENRQLVRDSASVARLLWVGLNPADRATEYDIDQALLNQLFTLQKSHSPQYISAFEGFALVLKHFRERRKLRTVSDINEEFYGFYLAPAFNAVRRVDGDMVHAFGAFTAQTREQKAEHIEQVLDYNELRKELVERSMEGLQLLDQPYAPRIWLTYAPAGMLGLMANKLMSLSGEPTIVLNAETLSGSARSPFWFPVVKTLAHHGFRAIGHENACGVVAGSDQELTRLSELLAEEIPRLYAEADREGELAKAMAADAVIGSDGDCDIDISDTEEMLESTKAIESLSPFGHGFTRPVYELRVDLSRCTIGTIGEEDSHLRIITASGMKLLWWNAADKLLDLNDRATSLIPGESRVRFTAGLSINVFMDNESVQAVIETMIDQTGAQAAAEDEINTIAFTG